MGMGHSIRHVLAALAFAGVLAFFCVLLVQAQVIQGEGYYETSLRSKAKVESVPAARGKILDRNGKGLVRDEVRWTAVVAEGAPEESRARLAQLCREEGVRWDGEGAVTGVTARLLARGKEEGLEGGGGARGKRGTGPPCAGARGGDEPGAVGGIETQGVCDGGSRGKGRGRGGL